MQPYKKLILNETDVTPHTRHFIVGDVHGQYSTLLQLLHKINYDPNIDYLYTTGDMIDRGPESVEVVKFFTEHDRRFSTLGNHETMAFNWDPPDWLVNGGYSTVESLEKHNLGLDWLKPRVLNLPIILDVKDNFNNMTFRIVHAEIPSRLNENLIQLKINKQDRYFLEGCLWGKNDLCGSDLIDNGYEVFGKEIAKNQPIPTYVGHNIVADVVTMGTRRYLNAPMGDLFIINVADNIVYKHSELIG